jgi:hypothetical protein
VITNANSLIDEMARAFGSRDVVTPTWIQEGAENFCCSYPDGSWAVAVTCIAHKTNRIPKSDFALMATSPHFQKEFVFNVAELSWQNAFKLYPGVGRGLQWKYRVHCKNPLILTDPTIFIDVAFTSTDNNRSQVKHLPQPFMVRLPPHRETRAHYKDGTAYYTESVITRRLGRL